jgi:hypothetical protein
VYLVIGSALLILLVLLVQELSFARAIESDEKHRRQMHPSSTAGLNLWIHCKLRPHGALVEIRLAPSLPQT